MTSGRLSESRKGVPGKKRRCTKYAVPRTQPNIATRVITVRPNTSQMLQDGFSSGGATAGGSVAAGIGDSGIKRGTEIGFSGADTGCERPSRFNVHEKGSA